MANLRTFTCSNCGATLATSAEPGTSIDCEYCGSANTVPSAATQPAAQARPGGEQPAAPEAEPARPDADPARPEPAPQPAARSDETVLAPPVRSGMPGSLPPVPRDGEAPARPDSYPQPDSPAAVGYDVDVPNPTAARGPEQETAREIEIPAGPGGDRPSLAEVIAEPMKHGAGVPAEQGDPIAVAPDRIKVVPPQQEPFGTPGKSLTNRSPMLLVGGVIACCLLSGGAALCLALITAISRGGGP